METTDKICNCYWKKTKSRRGDILKYDIYKNAVVIRQGVSREEALREVEKNRVLINVVDKIWDEMGLKGRGCKQKHTNA